MLILGFLKAFPVVYSTNFLLAVLLAVVSFTFSLRFGVYSFLVLEMGGNLVTVLELL